MAIQRRGRAAHVLEQDARERPRLPESRTPANTPGVVAISERGHEQPGREPAADERVHRVDEPGRDQGADAELEDAEEAGKAPHAEEGIGPAQQRTVADQTRQAFRFIGA